MDGQMLHVLLYISPPFADTCMHLHGATQASLDPRLDERLTTGSVSHILLSESLADFMVSRRSQEEYQHIHQCGHALRRQTKVGDNSIRRTRAPKVRLALAEVDSAVSYRVPVVAIAVVRTQPWRWVWATSGGSRRRCEM